MNIPVIMPIMIMPEIIIMPIMTCIETHRLIIMHISITKMDAIIMASMIRARAVFSLREQAEAASVQDTEEAEQLFIFALEK